MMPNRKPLRLGLMLLPLAMLLASCGTDSPLLQPPAVVQPAIIPPLPETARQPSPPPICSPTCSSGYRKLLDQLLSPPINLASPGTPAKPLTKP